VQNCFSFFSSFVFGEKQTKSVPRRGSAALAFCGARGARLRARLRVRGSSTQHPSSGTGETMRAVAHERTEILCITLIYYMNLNPKLLKV